MSRPNGLDEKPFMGLLATALVLAGAFLGIAALYELAGDAEPDGQQLESIGKRRN